MRRKDDEGGEAGLDRLAAGLIELGGAQRRAQQGALEHAFERGLRVSHAESLLWPHSP